MVNRLIIQNYIDRGVSFVTWEYHSSGTESFSITITPVYNNTIKELIAFDCSMIL